MGPEAGSVARGLRMAHVWFVIALAVPMIDALLTKMPAADLAYQVRAGDIMLRTHSLLRTDVFTFTVPGAQWLNQQWGAQLFLDATYRLGGWNAMVLLHASADVSGVRVHLPGLPSPGRVDADRRAAERRRLLGGPAEPGHATAADRRPALLDHALDPGGTPHASPSPVGHPGPHAHLGERARQLRAGAAAARSRVARGSQGLARRRRARSSPCAARRSSPRSRTRSGCGSGHTPPRSAPIPTISARVTEWAPPTVREYSGVVFFVSALVIVGYLVRRGAPVAWPPLIWLATFFVLALPALRGVVWWGLVFPVVIAGLATRKTDSDEEHGSPFMNALLVTTIAAAVILVMPFWRGPTVDGNPAHLDQAPSTLVRATRPSWRPDPVCSSRRPTRRGSSSSSLDAGLRRLADRAVPYSDLGRRTWRRRRA